MVAEEQLHKMQSNHLSYIKDEVPDYNSWYNSKPIDLELKAIEYWLNNWWVDMFGKRFHQIIGTALAPPYLCLMVGFLEETKQYPVLLD